MATERDFLTKFAFHWGTKRPRHLKKSENNTDNYIANGNIVTFAFR